MENAETKDRYWNAAMAEMVKTGYMHNYMRMYWGKKILEWCNTPEYAYETTLYLNNKYFLRRARRQFVCQRRLAVRPARPPWQERPVFGKIPLHDRQRAGAEIRHRRLCRPGSPAWADGGRHRAAALAAQPGYDDRTSSARVSTATPRGPSMDAVQPPLRDRAVGVLQPLGFEVGARAFSTHSGT